MKKEIKRVRGRYIIEDVGIFPAVTTICSKLDKPALRFWFGKVVGEYILEKMRSLVEDYGETRTPRELFANMELNSVLEQARKQPALLSEEAMDIGRRVHGSIEAFFKGQDFIILPDIEKPWEAFLSQVKDYELKPVSVEDTVWLVKRGGYAGTLDLVAELKPPGARKKRTYVIDFKTSSGFYPEYNLQLAAYYYAWNDMYPTARAEGAAILRLDKETGIPEWKFYTKAQLKKAFQGFICLVEYYHKMKKK